MRITRAIADNARTLLDRLRRLRGEWEPYRADLLAFLRRPANVVPGAALRPGRTALALLLAAGCLAAVPLLRLGWEGLAMRGVSPTVTRTVTKSSGFLGLGTTTEKKKEANPEYARLREKARDGSRWLWLPGGAFSLLSLLLLLPGVAAAAPRGKTGKAAGEDGTLPLMSIPETAIGPDGRYLLREMVGKGAMGVVYRGWDRSLEREVAVKEMPKPLTEDTEPYTRFRREALTLAKLSHPCVVQVFDLFEREGRCFLVMEFMGGGDLGSLVEKEGRLDIKRVGTFGLALCDALAYVHAQGVVHRDLKPGNILLNERKQPKISDFGLARWDLQGDLTREGAMLGSPNWMSPEQVAGKKADRRSDLYSFGALLYWLATGAPPFTGEVEAVLAQHLTRLPDPPSTRNPKIPKALNSLIMCLLAKDPADREQDMEKMRKVLAGTGTGK